MIVYTPLPQELIWEGYDKPPEYFWGQIEGRTVQLERTGDTKARIVRLYSSDPLDYLNPLFAPGREIELTRSRMSTRSGESGDQSLPVSIWSRA